MDHRKFGKLLVAACAACTALAAGGVRAEDYPSRPITLVVPYGPGGNADLAARALAYAVQKDKLLGQSIVVENRAGAGGMVGTQYVANSRKDGYTLLLARVGSQVVAPALDPVTPYKWDDLAPIGLLEIDPYVCVVKASSPYKTFKELLEAIKAKPGKLSYATSSNMDASVVFPVKAMLDIGLKPDAAIKVPYKGAGATVTAILGGFVDFTCNGLAPYLGGMNGGTLRALVVSTPRRIPEAPDVPTVGELGMKDLEMVSGWSALYGPPGLPDDVVRTWQGVLEKAGASQSWLAQVHKRGTVPSIMTPAQTLKFAGDQYAQYHALSPYIGLGK